ncbi:hypothetical protein GCM10007049_01210 [Echinicola pacifica]|uniref:BT-3987-like N-terminal domain-containing protein n=1 Tax=Echinicola pacifica TaxID=346377 RepID=A0A918PJP7_9BACT|nr:DUF1735 domain-containing protein [Echinicola pacifica]GGZ13191.1 hypothetical protein GCM10007049_01210 [Echinicola pacifica]
MMKINNIILGVALLAGGLMSCEPYEDYIEDFDYTIVYFGSQKPLRTIVAYDEMEFKVGVAMGGKRTSEVQEYADFVVDPSLLEDEAFTGGNEFVLLPESYYTLSDDSRMLIPAGKYIGDITVSLNRENFTNDPDATSNTYALPIRITASSLDSIASGSYDDLGNVINPPKNYTILVVKYISPYSGTYYHKGAQVELDENGEVVNEVVYNNQDLIKNATWNLSTITRNQVLTPQVGNNQSGSIILTVDEDSNLVSISTEDDQIQDLQGQGTYSEDESAFYIEYSFMKNEADYLVKDTLIIRQAPELDLGFEEW